MIRKFGITIDIVEVYGTAWDKGAQRVDTWIVIEVLLSQYDVKNFENRPLQSVKIQSLLAKTIIKGFISIVKLLISSSHIKKTTTEHITVLFAIDCSHVWTILWSSFINDRETIGKILHEIVFNNKAIPFSTIFLIVNFFVSFSKCIIWIFQNKSKWKFTCSINYLNLLGYSNSKLLVKLLNSSCNFVDRTKCLIISVHGMRVSKN